MAKRYRTFFIILFVFHYFIIPFVFHYFIISFVFLQLSSQIVSALLSTPNLIILKNHPPPPRTSIAVGAPPCSLTARSCPIGSLFGSEKSPGIISNVIPWQSFDLSTSMGFCFSPSVGVTYPVLGEGLPPAMSHPLEDEVVLVNTNDGKLSNHRKRRRTSSYRPIQMSFESDSSDSWGDVSPHEISYRSTGRCRGWLQQSDYDSDTSSSSREPYDDRNNEARPHLESDHHNSKLDTSERRVFFSSLVEPPDRAILFPSQFLNESNSSDSNQISQYHTPFPNSGLSDFFSLPPQPSVSVFESMRQIPTTTTCQTLPWIFTSGALLTVPNSAVFGTSLWTINGPQITSLSPTPDSSWLGMTGLLNGTIGRPTGPNITLGCHTPSVDEYFIEPEKMDDDPAMMSSVLLSKTRKPIHSILTEATPCGVLTDTKSPEPTNVLEVFQMGLKHIPSLKATALAILTGSSSRPPKHSNKKSTELAEEWERELFSLAAKSVASDHLVFLELRRLCSMLETFSVNMKRRAEANSR